MIVLSSVHADTFYQSNSTINYTLPCANNGTLCSTATVCNLTLLYSNDSVILMNKNMSTSAGFVSYLLYPNMTTQNGMYKSYITCYDSANGLKGNFYTSFTLTSGGNPPANDNFSIVIYMLFLFAAAGMLYSIVRVLELFAEWNVNPKDLMIAWGFVFLMYFVIYISSQYIVNPFLPNWGLLLINIIGYGIMITAFLGLIISAIVRNMKIAKQERKEREG